MKKLHCILLVDDEDGSNYLNHIIIEEANCAEHVKAVRKVKDALHYITDSAQLAEKTISLPYPDLILLDIYMPEMDGWDFLMKFKEIKNILPQPPVIILHSLSQNPADDLKARQIPEVAGIHQKPLTPEMIHSIVSTHFPHYL